MSLATKVLLGILIALMAAAGMQTYRLDRAAERNAILQANAQQMKQAIAQAQKAHKDMMARAQTEAEILRTRAQSRETRINALSEQLTELQEIEDDEIGCLDNRMPDGVIRLLDRAGNHGGGAAASLPATGADG